MVPQLGSSDCLVRPLNMVHRDPSSSKLGCGHSRLYLTRVKVRVSVRVRVRVRLRVRVRVCGRVSRTTLG